MVVKEIMLLLNFWRFHGILLQFFINLPLLCLRKIESGQQNNGFVLNWLTFLTEVSCNLVENDLECNLLDSGVLTAW